MDTSIPSSKPEEMVGEESMIDNTMPWGIYIPPSIGHTLNNDTADNEIGSDNDVLSNEPHGGFIRIVNAKGKYFPCGFSRPIGYVMDAITVTGKKRTRSELLSECGDIQESNNARECDDTSPPKDETEVKYEKRTITEDRLHPEEALFLQMRGLLRIESHSSDNAGESKEENIANSTRMLTTQDLFCKMLPECKVPLAAYLAYAHLRAQGYILLRYTDQRMGLLCKMNHGQQLKHSTKLDEILLQNDDASNLSAAVSEEKKYGEDSDIMSTSQNDKTDNGNDRAPITSSKERFKTRPLRLKLSDDVATSLQPCIVSLETDGKTGKPKIRLAYYAYNPNARFRRSNPGLPDFGVVVMPFHSDPTFDTLSSLVSMCEGGGGGGEESGVGDSKSGIPLRVLTVADGGAVVAFSVTTGDVPSINQTNSCNY